MQTKLKNVDDIYALTGMQQLMLVHALRDAKSATLQEQFSLALDGRMIDQPHLKQARSSPATPRCDCRMS